MLAKYEVSLLKNAELDWMIHLKEHECFWFPVSVLFWKCFSIISSVKTRISNAFLVWPKTHPAERTEVTGSWAVCFESLLTGDARLQENSTIQNMSILLLSLLKVMQWSSMNYWQTKPLSVTCYLLQVPISAVVVDGIDSSFCSFCLSSFPNAIDHCPVTVFAACPSSSHLMLCLSPFADTIDCYFSQSLF